MEPTKEEKEIIARAAEIQRKYSFNSQIEKLPEYLQGGTVPSKDLDKNPEFFLVDIMTSKLTHHVSLSDSCVYFRELRGDIHPFIIIHQPDSSNVPEGYDSGIYIPDHLHIAINWGDSGEKGDVKVIIDSDEFPCTVVLRDSEKALTVIDERKCK